jgi:hypothetical protein
VLEDDKGVSEVVAVARGSGLAHLVRARTKELGELGEMQGRYRGGTGEIGGDRGR